MIKERKYPIGIQSFADIRQEGYVYIDKTAYVYQMTHAAKYNFLSRPRRFGKSLLVSTLQAYFEGQKELFHGLAIEQMEQEWTPYPVLHIDFSTSKFYSIEELTGYIDDMLEGYERVYGASKEGQPFSIRFKNIISRAYEQTGRKVVVLIDEYDYPLFDSMEDDKLQRQIQNTFQGHIHSFLIHLDVPFLLLKALPDSRICRRHPLQDWGLCPFRIFLRPRFCGAARCCSF